MMPVSIEFPSRLLGLPPNSDEIKEYISQVSHLASLPEPPSPDVKIYRTPKPGVLYTNYYKLGLSFLFSPKDGTGDISLEESHIASDTLKLDTIDIYNISEDERRRPSSRIPAYASHPVPILTIPPTSSSGDKGLSPVVIRKSSTGKTLVEGFGEPDRKGGGSGPSSGSIGIWCEWDKKGVMIEFGGAESSGPQAWEKGKDAKWKILTLFSPKV